MKKFTRSFQYQYQVLIPARKGSKRFPGKNTINLGGISLIEHSIIYALQLFPSENIWVNTDDEEILRLVRKYNVKTTKRPARLASDSTPTVEVCLAQINDFTRLSIPCDALILLQPTNPIRPKKLLYNSILDFECSNRQSLATFTLLNRKIGFIKDKYFYPSNYRPGQRMQDIENDYFENGLLYITRVESVKKGNIITDDVLPVIVNDTSAYVDIDYPDDLIFAEFLLNRYHIKKN